MMGRICEATVVGLLLLSLLNIETSLAKKGSSSGSRRTSNTGSRSGTQSKPNSGGTSNRNPNPYPAGGSYPHPGTGNTNPGGYPRQNPGSYPGAGNTNPGGYPRQNPGSYPGVGNTNPGGYPRQNPGGYPNQNPGGYPNQNPGGGYPAGGYPNQYPGRGNYPAGGYPAGGNPAGGYPAGGYPAGGYPAGGYPARGYPAGGYPAGGYPAGGYPAGGGYPARGGNTGWGSPGGYPAANPGGYPGGFPGGGAGGQYNWNPNNKILSPRYGGGGYGFGGYGQGGSPFSRTVQSMDYRPKSTGFAKKALMAAGVGAVAGMAIGYGVGRFPRPHMSFRNPEEEYYYNNYMYRRYGSKSTDEKDYGRDYVYQPPPRAESYEKFMDRCMNRTDLLKDQDKDADTVSIEEIGYPELIEQLKTRKCVENYMKYSESFLKERSAQQQQSTPSRSTPLSFGGIQLLGSVLMLLSSTLLLQ